MLFVGHHQNATGMRPVPTNKENFMRILPALLSALLVSCASIVPTATENSRTLIESVFEDFNACNIDRLVSRYSDSNLVFFTGGTSRPVVSHAGLREYFSYLTAQPCTDPGSPKHINIALQVRPLASTAAVVHATTLVKYVDDGVAQSRPFFFTFVVQEVSGRWLVISQNAQAIPKE
jgi:hypothetical protein